MQPFDPCALPAEPQMCRLSRKWQKLSILRRNCLYLAVRPLPQPFRTPSRGIVGVGLWVTAHDGEGSAPGLCALGGGQTQIRPERLPQVEVSYPAHVPGLVDQHDVANRDVWAARLGQAGHPTLSHPLAPAWGERPPSLPRAGQRLLPPACRTTRRCPSC